MNLPNTTNDELISRMKQYRTVFLALAKDDYFGAYAEPDRFARILQVIATADQALVYEKVVNITEGTRADLAGMMGKFPNLGGDIPKGSGT